MSKVLTPKVFVVPCLSCHDSYFPVPRTQSEIENLKTVLIEIGLPHDSAIIIGVRKCDDYWCGGTVWFSQNEATSSPDFEIDMSLIGGLDYDTSEKYVILNGQDSDFTFGSGTGSARVNPVCYKAPLTGRK